MHPPHTVERDFYDNVRLSVHSSVTSREQKVHLYRGTNLPLHPWHYGCLSVNRWLATDVSGLRTVGSWTLIGHDKFAPKCYGHGRDNLMLRTEDHLSSRLIGAMHVVK